MKKASEIPGTIHVVCRDCGAAFTIEPRELQWLRERKLEPFSRCRECRRKRRESQARQAAAAPPGERKRPW